jgi:hypothetical protein
LFRTRLWCGGRGETSKAAEGLAKGLKGFGFGFESGGEEDEEGGGLGFEARDGEKRSWN